MKFYPLIILCKPLDIMTFSGVQCTPHCTPTVLKKGQIRLNPCLAGTDTAFPSPAPED